MRYSSTILIYNVHFMLYHAKSTKDSTLCGVIQNLQSSRRFYMELNNERNICILLQKKRYATRKCFLPYHFHHTQTSANALWNNVLQIRIRSVHHRFSQVMKTVVHSSDFHCRYEPCNSYFR